MPGKGIILFTSSSSHLNDGRYLSQHRQQQQMNDLTMQNSGETEWHNVGTSLFSLIYSTANQKNAAKSTREGILRRYERENYILRNVFLPRKKQGPALQLQTHSWSFSRVWVLLCKKHESRPACAVEEDGKALGASNCCLSS